MPKALADSSTCAIPTRVRCQVCGPVRAGVEARLSDPCGDELYSAVARSLNSISATFNQGRGTMWQALFRRPAVPLHPPVRGRCGGGRHVLRSERLLLYTPLIALDVIAPTAARSDAEAQRWLGSRTEEIVQNEDAREVFLSMRADDDLSGFETRDRLMMMRKVEKPTDGVVRLTAVHVADGRYAGATSVSLESGEIGGWLAPDYRRQGLGVELFRAAVQLGHRHLGLKVVRAGAEPTNNASRRALASAGFTPAPGPARFTLGDGREIDATWHQHRQEATSRCRG
ncbi:GNAT family N-acetyltransferase [Streptomyces sp. NBC_00715]|uniref:GNAT family N-acetyltransferase n=1 Tax=Streptomyces sp. NBC_00715 TaxID=2975811 RepID=UPI00386C9294